jgi:hypothetical protein
MWETFNLIDSVEHNSKSERTLSTNVLKLRTNDADFDVCLRDFSNMCQELLIPHRRNINISRLASGCSLKESKFVGSEMLTGLYEPVRPPAANFCLEKYVNASNRQTQEPPSSRISSAAQRKPETLLKYVHPILSADRNDVVLEVECGSNKGLLYLSRLYRGSRGACILYQGTWLTPNQFQAVSGREIAKDWKRSIRHHGRSIKLLMSKAILPQNSECHYQTSAYTSPTFHVSNLYVVTVVKNAFQPLPIPTDICLKYNVACII